MVISCRTLLSTYIASLTWPVPLLLHRVELLPSRQRADIRRLGNQAKPPRLRPKQTPAEPGQYRANVHGRPLDQDANRSHFCLGSILSVSNLVRERRAVTLAAVSPSSRTTRSSHDQRTKFNMTPSARASRLPA